MLIPVTIDGRRIAVPPGTTILNAAQLLGIRIPTLCHVAGLEPAASCSVCAVQVEGRRNFAPSCALPVSEGMVVVTGSEEVRTARRIAIELLISDHAGDCVSPCSAACPAGLDIAGFVLRIAGGDAAAAMPVIAESLALPGALGRICPRLCEQHCRRKDLDSGLAIGSLHRYAADRDRAAEARYRPPLAPPSGKSAAIVGAGPAGLAAAYYLAQKGHRCVIFEAKAQAGGMLRYGVPAFRLPKDSLEDEIAAVRDLGVEFRMGRQWGKDFTLADLRLVHDVVFLAIGAQGAQELPCPGKEHAFSGIEFLESIANGNRPVVGDDVVVVGGGNTALDCARSALRLGPRRVRVLYRRSRREMPCSLDEVAAAEAEGIEFEYLTAPARLERESGGGLRLACYRMRLGEPDASGRRRPETIPGSEFEARCSFVVAAIGQSVVRGVAEQEGLRTTAWGIEAEPRTLATNLPGVFAGGDAVLGPDWAVRAVAAGRMAAFSMDQWLRGEPVTGEPVAVNVSLQPIDDEERAEILRAVERSSRVRMPEIGMERRVATFDEVDQGLDGSAAERESRRCMTCGCRKADCCRVRSLAAEYGADVTRFNGARRRFAQDRSHPEVVYEPGKCILCNACVRIAERAGEALGLAPIGRGFDVAVNVPFGETLAAGLRVAARECAEACPTGALAFRGTRACELCG